VLGKVAEGHPELIRRIHDAGHEIPTHHGYSHEKVYNLYPERFRRELRHSTDLNQDLWGERARGYRAPYFTITEDSLRTPDILREEGFLPDLYDSSIHPVFNYRHGIPNADRQSSVVESDDGAQLLEVTVATYPLPDPMPDANIPCGGGAYPHIYAYWFQRWLLRRIEERGEHISM
jgi:peptidoglycan/xylan/chitin deacetylase (PgdA/CDA1 family)